MLTFETADRDYIIFSPRLSRRQLISLLHSSPDDSYLTLNTNPSYFELGLYLGLSAVDHACCPNANVVFRGRTAEVRAMELVADFASCRISYIHDMLPATERQRLLEEQYFFTCNCRLCSVAKEDLGGTVCQPVSGLLRCGGCSAPVSCKGNSECQQCGRSVAVADFERYKVIVHEAEKLSEPNNVMRLWEESQAVAHPWDMKRIQLAELAMKAALDNGEVERFYAVGQSIRANYETFFHPNSISFGLYCAKMAKAAYYVEETTAGGNYLQKALAVCSLTYGESHPLFSYLLHTQSS